MKRLKVLFEVENAVATLSGHFVDDPEGAQISEEAVSRWLAEAERVRKGHCW